MELDLNLTGHKPPRCTHCGREKGSHRAVTFECPMGRGSFTSFHANQKYEPCRPNTKKPTAD